MDTTIVAQRFRLFLFALAGLMCIGTSVELWLADHTESGVQLIPFGLCGLGLIVVLAALLWPHRGTLIAVWTVMPLLILGSLLGIYEHLEGNIGFALEIRPNATTGDVFFEALKGANPLLAPGILALAGTLALAATYYHPAWKRQDSTRR